MESLILYSAEGTRGAETVVTVELERISNRTNLRLTLAGFMDEVSRDQHKEAWPLVLKQLDETYLGSTK